MLYQPPRPDRFLWDTWLLPQPERGRYHLFHMQKVAGEADSVEIGHAVSADLVRWTALDPALRARGAGAWDSVRLRTGTALHHEGRTHLFYGAAPDHVDQVGLATSTDPDLRVWEREGGVPLSTPDPRWYEHDLASCPIGNVAWRDPCIRRDPEGWTMYLTARHRSGPPAGRGTVATLRSDGDLRRWRAGPPLTVPPDYTALEVPDVFELQGRWFLLHSTSYGMGARFPTCDPALTAGTYVLWATRPEGPYERPPRDVLVGSPASRMSAYVCRTAETPRGRIAYYHNVYPQPPGSRARRGSFALPKGLAVDGEGLTLRYLPLLEPYLVGAPGPPLDAEVAGGGLVARPLAGGGRDLLLSATVTVEAGVGAGIGLRRTGAGGGLAVLLDARRGAVAVLELTVAPDGRVGRQVLAERRAALRQGVPVALRVVLARDTVDVFLDDDLQLSVVAEGHAGEGLALLAESARVRFEGVRAGRLDLPAPETG